jgi:hypothetical protein
MNWDDAYANAPYIENAETYPPAWAHKEEAFGRHSTRVIGAVLQRFVRAGWPRVRH